MKAKKRILYPTDFSPAAKPAFEYALEAAKRDGAIVIVLHVIEPTSPFADDVYLALPGPAREAAEAGARRQFDDLLARAKAADVDASDVLRCGRPAEEIAKVAESEFADLIVMGTHGRRGLRRLMLGSVAQQVVATAPCPVVTVRMKDPLP
jgi:nucleotide-binding universal stress UspA family protein